VYSRVRGSKAVTMDTPQPVARRGKIPGAVAARTRTRALKLLAMWAVSFRLELVLFFSTPTGSIHPTKRRKHAHKFSTFGPPPPLV
jgi:hypothetical protein